MEGLYQERGGATAGGWGALMGTKMDGFDSCQEAEKLNTGLCAEIVCFWP